MKIFILKDFTNMEIGANFEAVKLRENTINLQVNSKLLM